MNFSEFFEASLQHERESRKRAALYLRAQAATCPPFPRTLPPFTLCDPVCCFFSIPKFHICISSPNPNS